MKHNVQQCAIHFQIAIVFNETQFSEFVQEDTHPGTGRANHIRKGRLGNPGEIGSGSRSLP